MVVAPLTSLLRKDKFQWSNIAQTTFKQLKHKMTEAPVLVSSDFSIPFTIETDTCSRAIGPVLQQNSYLIAYYSRMLCPRLQLASAYVRELHAIIVVVQKWRHNLLGHSFTILTDHRSLKELMSQAIQTPEHKIYLSKLLGYNYVIQYKSGPQNVVAGALSKILASKEA